MQRTVRLLLLLLVLVTAKPVLAQCGLNKDYKKGLFPNAAKGEQPPGDAMKLNVGIARILIKQLLEKRYPLTVPSKLLLPGATFFESKNVKVSRTGFSFDYETADKKARINHNTKFVFKDLDYTIYGPGDTKEPYYCVASYSKAFRAATDAVFFWHVLTWKEEKDARSFANAFNRLVYDARRAPTDDDLPAFESNVKQWRDNPQSTPKPPDGWDKYRILAEQAIRDKDFIAAIENYEAGVAAHPPWAEGWFNAALLYEALGDYEYAAGRMRRYLALMPDAPDANAAREKVIVWDHKALQ